MDHSFIYLIHILVAGPILIYSGLSGNKLSKDCKNTTFLELFQLLVVIGIGVILYHGYKLLEFKGMIE